MTPITESDDLFAAAFKSERVLARRLAKKIGVSEIEALKKILEIAAGPLSIMDLVAQRAAEKIDADAKAAHRRREKADALARKKAVLQPLPFSWLGWFDGSATPNPGKIGIGCCLKSPEGKSFELSRAAGHGDGNDAEYLALIALLEMALPHRPAMLVVYGDSRVVIDDMTLAGASCFEHHRLQARRLMAELDNVTLQWVPRRKNGAADALSQDAIDRVAAVEKAALSARP